MGTSLASLDRARPFTSAEDAWFWAVDVVRSASLGAWRRCAPAPCRPHDLLILGMEPLLTDQARAVLFDYGRRGYAPDEGSGDRVLWDWAMLILGAAMRRQGWAAEGGVGDG